MPTVLRAPEPQADRPVATAGSHDLDRWYDADAVTFRGGDDASPELGRRIDTLRAGNPYRVDSDREAERAGLPRR
jgi:hypothetical protein